MNIQKMIEDLEREHRRQEDIIGEAIAKQQQLEIAKLNIEGYRDNNLTSATLATKHESEPEPEPKPKKKVSAASRRKMAAAQQRRWAKFRALGKQPLQVVRGGKAA